MTEAKKEKIKVVIDIIKLKNNLVKKYQVDETLSVDNNFTYAVLEMLISTLFDKYDIKDREIEEILYQKN